MRRVAGSRNTYVARPKYQNTMKYCEFCGAPLDDDALYCTKCGAKLSNTQPDASQTDDALQNPTLSHSATLPHDRKGERAKQQTAVRTVLFVLLGVVLVAGVVAAVLLLGQSKKADDRAIDETEEYVEQRKYTLYGAVDKYPIYMKLTIKGNVATGSYYYESQGPGKLLDLKGIYDNSKLELFETNENGQQTGHFKGQLKKGIFIGDFYDARGNSMHFRLEE